MTILHLKHFRPKQLCRVCSHSSRCGWYLIGATSSTHSECSSEHKRKQVLSVHCPVNLQNDHLISDKQTQANHDSPLQTPKKAHVEGAAGTLQEYPPVEPLAEFKWEETEPIQLRPFKPKYHLTMCMWTFRRTLRIFHDTVAFSTFNADRICMYLQGLRA